MNKGENLLFHVESYIRKCLNYGPRWAVADFLYEFRTNKSDVRRFDKECIRYLEKNYEHVIDKYKNYKDPQNILPEDAPIYIFWLQGEEKMPPIVKVCYESIKRHRGNHPVIFMDKNNVEEYVNVPDYFKEKMLKGIFTVQCLTNILRNYLLSETGGIWCDATVFLTKPITICEKFNMGGGGYYTIKGNEKNREGKYNWYDHFMIGAKGNVLNAFLAEAHLEYYKKENARIDYNVMPYFAFRAYENVASIKNLLDAVPVNNPDQFFLVRHYKETYNPEEINKIKEKTSIFKLDWRLEHVDDPDSIYQHILRGEI